MADRGTCPTCGNDVALRASDGKVRKHGECAGYGQPPMPRPASGLKAPPRKCIEPGCPRDARPGPRHSRCRPHQRAWDRARNTRPSRQAYQDPAYKNAIISKTCGVPGCTEPATKDHIVELHEGGTNDPSNIQALCLKHNLEKSNKQRKARKQNG